MSAMDPKAPPCRLFVRVAAKAPVAAVFRRGPSKLWHLLEWRLDDRKLKPGAWFSGSLYPRLSHIAPDGDLLVYHAQGKPSDSWPASFVAVSKLPWLTALVAWENGASWFQACRFSSRGTLEMDGEYSREPFFGNWPGRLRHRSRRGVGWKLVHLDNEQSSGWQKTAPQAYLARIPSRSSRSVPLLALEKKAARSEWKLVSVSRNAGKGDPAIEGLACDYLIRSPDGAPEHLEGVSWADWSPTGELLQATEGGELRILERKGSAWSVVWARNLNELKPEPTRAPKWARHW